MNSPSPSHSPQAQISAELQGFIAKAINKERIRLSDPSNHPSVILITDFNEGLPQSECRGSIIRYGVPSGAIDDQVNTVAAFDIPNAAFHLHQRSQTALAGDVIIDVVDPGVGNEEENDRRAIARTSDGIYLVGPNNGAFDALDITDFWEIDFEALKSHGIYEGQEDARHATFHGRDVFSPVGAIISHITAATDDPDLQAQLIEELVAKRLELSELHKLQLGEAEALHHDPYGNIKFNIALRTLEVEVGEEVLIELLRGETGRLALRIVDEESPESIRATVVNSFAEVEDGAWVLYEGSSKVLGTQEPAVELAKNLDSAWASKEAERIHNQ
jgi:S-adenosylmethionine hydrolase